MFGVLCSNVVVQGHVGGDSSPLGSTVRVYLGTAALSDRLPPQLRDGTSLTFTLRHGIVLSGSYPTYLCDGLLVDSPRGLN